MRQAGSMEQARGADELQVLRAQVLALAQAEAAAREQVEALKAQVAQLGQREAVGRAQPKEAQSLDRGLPGTTPVEGAEAPDGPNDRHGGAPTARAQAGVAA